MGKTTPFMLRNQYGAWGKHPVYTLEDWQYEVTNDNTRLGYWDWVCEQMEEEQDDGSTGN